MRPLLAATLVLVLAGCRAEEQAAIDPPAATGPEQTPATGTADAMLEQPHVGLMVHEPWSRPLAPGATVAAGYAVLMNHEAEDARLLSARAEGVGRVEVHTMIEVDGVVQMRPLQGGLVVPAGGQASLVPGGDHLMFFDVARPWSAGEKVPVTLAFENGLELVVDFAVGKAPGAASGATEPMGGASPAMASPHQH